MGDAAGADGGAGGAPAFMAAWIATCWVELAWAIAADRPAIAAGIDNTELSMPIKASSWAWPDDTIKVVCPQDDPDLVFHLSNYSAQWDLIIDDASHNGVKTMTSFGLLWPLVSPGGFYVIEDWFIGLPSWPSTGCWDGAPVGSAVVAASYDPELLHAVQNLVTLLDKPYCGVGAPGPFRDSEAESVTFRYGLAIVQKSA